MNKRHGRAVADIRRDLRVASQLCGDALERLEAAKLAFASARDAEARLCAELKAVLSGEGRSVASHCGDDGLDTTASLLAMALGNGAACE
jgi:hypothetical protein